VSLTSYLTFSSTSSTTIDFEVRVHFLGASVADQQPLEDSDISEIDARIALGLGVGAPAGSVGTSSQNQDSTCLQGMCSR